MDIDARIRRRQRRDATERLVLDYDALAPDTHVDEPTDRGQVLEQLLDHLNPVFDGDRPSNAYVWGPQGAGKSAVVTTLFEHLQRLPDQTESVIHTSTRAQAPTMPAFVTVDVRTGASEFAFYHAILDSLADESIPQHGIGTETLRSRLTKRLAGPDGDAVVLLDHVDEPATLTRAAILDLFEPIRESVSWVAVGRDHPEVNGWGDVADETIEIGAYQRQVLIDLLMDRASAALSQRALQHAHAREIASWAEGNAHDALAALFVAADAAAKDGHDRITEADVETGIADVPQNCVAIGRVFALPANRKAVLRELVGIDADERTSVSATTDAIAATSRIDLSAGTVKRFLYEMAESGILVREENTEVTGQGRPPSRVEPRFPPTVFERLYDLRQS